MVKALARSGLWLCCALAAGLVGCTDQPTASDFRKARGPVFDFTKEFVQNPRGGWEPSPVAGEVLAVTRPLPFYPSPAPPGGIPVSATNEKLIYAIFEGTHQD